MVCPENRPVFCRPGRERNYLIKEAYMIMNMVDFREMPYSRPDMDELKQCYEAVIAELKNAASYAEARNAFFSLQEKEKSAETMMSRKFCPLASAVDRWKL